MIHVFPEQRAELCRLALRCPDFPDRTLRQEMICWLADCVLIEPGCATRKAKMSMQGDQGLIMLPQGLAAELIDEVCLHEIAHFLLKHRVASFFREQPETELRSYRVLADRWEMAEEAEVEAFLLAFLLPSRLVKILKDPDLVEQSGCSPTLVKLRRHRLQGKVYDVRTPPEWSAHWRYTLSLWEDEVRPCFHVAHRDPRGRSYFVPVGAHEMREWEFRLSADLMALTVPEWQIKYASFEIGPERALKPTVQDLWKAASAPRPALGS